MIEAYVKRVDFAPDYWISACGRLFREKRTKGGGIKEIFGCMDNYGYKRTYLYVSGHERMRLRYHQIVAWVFLDEPVEGQWLIRHQDNDKQNNARWNLKFGTALENSYDTYRWRGEVYAR